VFLLIRSFSVHFGELLASVHKYLLISDLCKVSWRLGLSAQAGKVTIHTIVRVQRLVPPVPGERPVMRGKNAPFLWTEDPFMGFIVAHVRFTKP
jgi:hypothetical protein